MGAVDNATVSPERARVRVEAVRTGLAAGAAAGAGVGLLLALRRQAHQEYDTAERRITEMYNAAAEQLGSDKAPVRLAALYTLERLANDNPQHRQTIVNIICAYLRMPYTMIARGSSTDDDGRYRRTLRCRLLGCCAMHTGQPVPIESHPPHPHEEYQVRDTAQALLSIHLHPEAEVYWPDVDLNLIDATLTKGLNLTGCTLRSANFRRAVFVHGAFFNWATFDGHANFVGATFSGLAKFDETSFGKVAYFRGATFTTTASFKKAFFRGHVNFDELKGEGELLFEDATVADSNKPHLPPGGWRIEQTRAGGGRFLSERPPSPGLSMAAQGRG